MATSPDLQQVTDWPPGLRILNISNTGIASLEGLPATIEVLDIRGTPIRSLRELQSEVLRTLIVNPGQLSKLDGLPPSVTALCFFDPIGTEEGQAEPKCGQE